MRKLEKWMLAAILICGTVVCLTSCKDDDEPYPVEEDVIATPAQLKPGIWTEYDEALLASGKYTEEQLAAMPAVGMMLEGNKASFFTYTAEGASNAVEGQISYDNTEGTGSITFPAINNNPLSGQTVDFYMTTDETMQFVLTYEGKQTTATFAWLCENLNNWNQEIEDEDWEALMGIYQLIGEDRGADASIDWSDSDVEGLNEPLVWIEDIPETKAETRAVGIGTVVSIGANILGALFGGDEPDPSVAINQKLDKITGKLDQTLQNQEKMMEQMNLGFDKIDKHFEGVNERLKAIANKLNQQETVNIFNNRNTIYYNPLKSRNAYFDAAYKLYNENKSDLSKVSKTLGEYGKEWIGADGEKYIDLTWQYIEYITSVQHTTYGMGLDKIYDGMTFDKYAWEHLGTGDRLTYRVYDVLTITKSLFMIALSATYGDMSDIKKEGIYKNYNDNIGKLKAFCEFKVTNPDEFRVCQVKGGHFVMHKELQKYNYKGKNNEVPHPAIYGRMAVYNPEWHEAGAITIENPYELQSKLINWNDAKAIYEFYKSAVFHKEGFEWEEVFVTSDQGAGAVYSKEPDNNMPGNFRLLLNDPEENGGVKDGSLNDLWINPVSGRDIAGRWSKMSVQVGISEAPKSGKALWRTYNNTYNYYAAIVEKRY